MAKYEVKNDRKYADTHEWVLDKGDGVVEIGITDYAQHELGDLVYAEGEPEDSELAVGDICASVESVKAASDIYSPVAGTIVERNEDIESEPEKLNTEPYDTWMVRIKLADPAALDGLMDAAAYEAFVEKEEAEH